jgi:hypothetical protein
MIFWPYPSKGLAGVKLMQRQFRFLAIYHEAKWYHAQVRGPLITGPILVEAIFKLLRQNLQKCFRKRKILIFKMIYYGLQ